MFRALIWAISLNLEQWAVISNFRESLHYTLRIFRASMWAISSNFTLWAFIAQIRASINWTYL